MRQHLHAAMAVAAMSLTGMATPASSGPVETLESYIGDWKGAGALVGGQNPEPFRCRLGISKGNLNKINYAGRCSLIDMNLSVSGTIAFDDKAQRYQAAMSSNAGFTGLAVGQIKGDTISFDLREKQKDRDTVTGIPGILRAAGYHARRVASSSREVEHPCR